MAEATASEITTEVRYILSQFKDRFSDSIITEMLSDYGHVFGRQQRDRWRYSKSVMTFILALHGYPHGNQRYNDTDQPECPFGQAALLRQDFGRCNQLILSELSRLHLILLR